MLIEKKKITQKFTQSVNSTSERKSFTMVVLADNIDSPILCVGSETIQMTANELQKFGHFLEEAAKKIKADEDLIAGWLAQEVLKKKPNSLSLKDLDSYDKLVN